MGRTKRQRQKHKKRLKSNRPVRAKKHKNRKRSTKQPESAKRPVNEERQPKVKDARTPEPTKQKPLTCYLCDREISPKQQVEYTCPKCGNHACSSCIEIMDSLNGVCLACDNRIKTFKEIWDTFAFVGIIIAIIILLLLILAHYIPDSPAIPSENVGF